MYNICKNAYVIFKHTCIFHWRILLDIRFWIRIQTCEEVEWICDTQHSCENLRDTSFLENQISSISDLLDLKMNLKKRSPTGLTPVDCRRIRPPPTYIYTNEYPGYHTKSSDSVTPDLRLWGNVQYFFIAVTPRSTLTRIDRTCLDPIYGSNRTA